MLVKYTLPTVGSALDFVAHVSDAGCNVAMIMNGSNPTRYVLSDYECKTEMDAFCTIGALTEEPNDWDRQYFENAMK